MQPIGQPLSDNQLFFSFPLFQILLLINVDSAFNDDDDHNVLCLWCLLLFISISVVCNGGFSIFRHSLEISTRNRGKDFSSQNYQRTEEIERYIILPRGIAVSPERGYSNLCTLKLNLIKWLTQMKSKRRQ